MRSVAPRSVRWRHSARAPRWLAFLGRHSLIVYMIHQPLLMGALWLFLGR